MFGDTFNNQRPEQFPSRLRQIDYASPKFVAQQKQALRITHHSESNAPFQSKQYIIFPKIEQTIREQEIENRNNAFLSLASSHISLSQLQRNTVSAETLKLVYTQPYLRYQNVKKIRRISPEWRDQHVCKKSLMIPHHQGNYAMPGLPHSESRTGKLMNISFTKMQSDYTKYNSNFALSKREQEIRDHLRIAKLAPQVQQQQQESQQSQHQQSLILNTQNSSLVTQHTSQSTQRLNQQQQPNHQMSSTSGRDMKLTIQTGRSTAGTTKPSSQIKTSTPNNLISTVSSSFQKTLNTDFNFLTAYSKSPSQTSSLNNLNIKEQSTPNQPISPPKIPLE